VVADSGRKWRSRSTDDSHHPFIFFTICKGDAQLLLLGCHTPFSSIRANSSLTVARASVFRLQTIPNTGKLSVAMWCCTQVLCTSSSSETEGRVRTLYCEMMSWYSYSVATVEMGQYWTWIGQIVGSEVAPSMILRRFMSMMTP